MPYRSASGVLQYARALGTVALATIVRRALDPVLGDNNPYMAYYVAIALNAWFGGLGSSLVALAACVATVDYFFLPPRGSFGISGLSNQISHSIFVIIGLAVTLLTASLRSARARSEASEAEARRALEAERTQREWLRTTLSSIADAVITAGADGRVTSLNRAAERLTGWPASEASGRPLCEVFRTLDQDTQQTDEMAVADVLENGSILRPSEPVALVSRGGASTPVEQSVAPILDRSGAITGMVLVFRDVTERLLAERSVRESEERFRQLAENITDVFWVADPRAERILYVSPAFETIWGRSVESLYRDPGSFPETIHPDDRERVLGAIERQGRGEPLSEEYRVVRPDGTERWIWDRGFPILDDRGEVTRVTGLAEDITVRRHAEAALREADRRKDEFLAMLAHELRNPLAPVSCALEMMKRPGLGPADFERERSMSERQVRHMARLIDDLMDVSRISRGRIAIRKAPVELSAILGRAAEAAGPLLAERGHALSVEMPDRPIHLEADPTRIEQVLANLLNNASRYTDHGGRVWLSAGLEAGQAVIRVRDTGIGIDPAMLGRVFDLFVQAEPGRARSRGGLGLGLSLVKSLVELHGGSVRAGSQGPGRGSEFTVRLPAVAGHVEPAPKPARPSVGPKDRRVLVVDDNVDAAESLGRLLSRIWGLETRVAFDGPSALGLARSFRPEVVLLDIGLPGMDGCEVARRLRAEPGLADALLVAVTGWGQEADRLRVRQAGFDHHLVKPVHPDHLERILAADAEPLAIG